MTLSREDRHHTRRFAGSLLTREPEEEALPEVTAPARVPGSPFSFVMFLVSRHYRGQLALFVLAVATATAIEAMSPYVLGRMINALTAATQSGTGDWATLTPISCSSRLCGTRRRSSYAVRRPSTST